MSARPLRPTAPPPPLLPRLSMDAYAAWIEMSSRDRSAAQAARQKAIEERIRAPFRFPESVRGQPGNRRER